MKAKVKTKIKQEEFAVIKLAESELEELLMLLHRAKRLVEQSPAAYVLIDEDKYIEVLEKVFGEFTD